MRKIVNLLSAIGALGVVSLAIAPSVSARSLGAGNGRAAAGADQPCFDSNNTVAKNTCGTARNFEVGLPMDNSTLKSFSFTGQNVQCAMGVTNAFDTGFAGSVNVALPAGALSSSGNVAGPLFPAGGKAWVGCTLQPGGQLATISYNP